MGRAVLSVSGFVFLSFSFFGVGCLSCLLRAGRCVFGRIHLAIFSTLRAKNRSGIPKKGWACIARVLRRRRLAASTGWMRPTDEMIDASSAAFLRLCSSECATAAVAKKVAPLFDQIGVLDQLTEGIANVRAAASQCSCRACASYINLVALQRAQCLGMATEPP